jgi:hypothetical protein
MQKSFVLASMTVFFAGCVSVNTQPISHNSKADLHGQNVAQTSRKLPDFAAMTPSKAVFGLIGSAAMISAGNTIIADNKVPDPADSIASGLTSILANDYATHTITPSVQVIGDDPAQISAASNGAARFIIDVQTINWSIGYFPTDWTHYRVIYTAKARLIDTQSKSVVSEGFCKQIADNNANAPTYDELLANQAANLKARLSTASDECVKSLKTEMLSL